MSDTTTPISLPHAPMLSYIAGGTTPTRVRAVAARGIMVLALACLAWSVLFVASTAIGVNDRLASRRGVFFIRVGFVPPPKVTVVTVLEAIRELDDQHTFASADSYFSHDPVSFVRLGVPGRLVLLGYFIFPGIALFILAAPVRRGVRAASLMGVICIIPLIGAAVEVTLYECCAAAVSGFGIAGQAHYQELWWFLVLPVGVVVILLLKDLCSYLLWIARNPITDKPPVPFLPAGSQTTNP